MSDPHNLQRFIEAQRTAFVEACQELRRGQKKTHWIWFIFPQIKGLGTSDMDAKYAIASRDEALAYWRHPILGQRLREAVEIVNSLEGRVIQQILPPPDHLKFKSCMTLFGHIEPNEACFSKALQKYFFGEADPHTLAKL